MALPKEKGAEISITALGLGKPLGKGLFGKSSKEDEEEKGEPEGNPDEEDSSYGAEMAGEELLDAINSKDAKAIYDAIEAIVGLCGEKE